MLGGWGATVVVMSSSPMGLPGGAAIRLLLTRTGFDGRESASIAALASSGDRFMGWCQAPAVAARRPLRLICQLASGSRNRIAPSAIMMKPARVAIVPTSDHP